MDRKEIVYKTLRDLEIPFRVFEHPPLPTVEIAMQYWKEVESTHCKNLFFRNHKGNRHYLVIIDHRSNLGIHDLEKRLKQGKLSFASAERMNKYLGVEPGSVSLFGLINDQSKHVHVFLDKSLETCHSISFHPNDNRATVVISGEDFLRFLKWTGNSWEFTDLAG